ncbi:MAG TPA: TetR/AcrR family transcriptional regulator [Verrucomicrobiae bacterium]|nr:TetR/AcrR family transcriptional regulator [Verrucomicrobiae bacterium]
MRTKTGKKAQNRAPSAPESGVPILRYADYLRHQVTHAPKKTKGERTKEALKLGAICVLDDVGYHALRVQDVCDAAQVGSATFYLYFENRADITLQVLTEYLARNVELLPAREAGTSVFDTIRASNLRWLEIGRANAGLLRCVLQLGDEEPGFRELVHRSNRAWYERIALSILRRAPEGEISEDAALFAAYSLGAMMDEMARKLIVYPDPDLRALSARAVPKDADVAEFFAVLWHRALYGGAPIDEALSHTAESIANLRLKRDRKRPS